MKMTDNLRGATLMVVAMVCFTLNDTCMKEVSRTLPEFEALALRGTLTSIILFLVYLRHRHGPVRLSLHDRRMVSLRTFGEVASTLAFIAALPHMPLANISAILQFLPLGVTLGAALVFRHPIGWRRLTAIFVGLVGVLLIVRPGGAAFDHWTVIAVLSMLFVILRDLSTRAISHEVPSTFVAVLAATSVTLSAAILAPFSDLVRPDARQVVLILSAGVFLVFGYITVISAMRVGEIAVVTPFRYTSLVAAIVMGWLAFGDFPDRPTLIGAAIVVATGIYTFHRERKVAAVR